MEWQDEGFVLGTRRHGETSAILELMTPSRGRHLGIVRGGRSKRMRALLQPGNSVQATWRARLEDHLGTFMLEPTAMRAATLMNSQVGIFGVQTLASHLRLLPERDPHAGLYKAALVVADHLQDPDTCGQLMVRFELELLNELGFGLDLTRCADTGTREELVFVSPKSGRAVSRQSGMPWADRLLHLPSFLRSGAADPPTDPTRRDQANGLKSGFALTGHFLERHVYGPRAIKQPSEREGFIKALMKIHSA